MAPGGDTESQKLLSSIAIEIVDRTKRENPNIIAAYSDGSLARGDIVRGSDVDIGFIIQGSERDEKTIHRQLRDGVVFEWGFFPKFDYENVDDILANAGFTHDVATARIWYDPDNFLRDIQQIVREKSQLPGTIETRVRGQIKIIQDNYAKYQVFLREYNPRDLIQSLISIVRSLFAVPAAVLNKPVTNTRACLYCQRDARELSIPKYPKNVLAILGTRGIHREEVQELQTLAHSVYDASNFPRERVETFKAHLEIVDYLLEINEVEGATWPLLFWSMAWMRDLDRVHQKEELDRMYDLSLPIREAFGLVKTEDLIDKQTLIGKALHQAQDLASARFKHGSDRI